MNNNLTWLLDVSVIECLIILTVVGVLLSLRWFIVFSKPNDKSGRLVSFSENWHSESEKTVFESLATTADGLSKEEISKRLLNCNLP